MITGLVVVFLLMAMFLSIRASKLTIAGAIMGGIVGFLIYMGAGLTGIAMISTFFTLGVGATAWKLGEKQVQHLAEQHKGKRTAGQVLANAGVAGLLGIWIVLFPRATYIGSIMMAASFASATADTLSSELGMVYGRRFYNILTFKKDQKGLDGVISREGTLIGIGGSVIIAIVYTIGFGYSTAFFWILLAGTIGNITDSILGATLERKGAIHNDIVNFLNTLIAALIAGLLVWLFP